jgi:acylphosphatase
MSPARLLITVRGRVQGVGFRAWVEHQATSARLEGWVRNRRDGSVEALLAGSARAVADVVALCRHGPPASRVTEVLTEPVGADQLNLRYQGERFSVLPTV